MITDTQRLQSIAQQTLERANKQGADQVEVSIQCETGYTVTARKGDVETLEHHQGNALDITVYQQQRSGSAATTDFSSHAIAATVDKACAVSQYTSQDLFSGLAAVELMAHNYPDLKLHHHWNLSPEKAIAMAIQCETIARERDKRIKQTEGASVSTYDVFTLYANSHGFMGDYWCSKHSIHCGVVAEENGQMERDYEYTITRDPMELVSIEEIAKQAADKTLRRLGAKRLKTQRCPVIFHAKEAKGLLGHFVSAISGANLYRQTSFLCDQLNQRIFPEHITIYQKPHLTGAIGSAPFDDEGVMTKLLDFVRAGILVNYCLGSYSAKKLGMKTTGNAGGVHNLLIHHSNKNLASLLRQMDRGLLVTELMGQGVNLLTGNYSRGAFGFWVENGEIQYPVHEITIAGNLKEMFKSVVAVANDVDHRGNIKTGSILLEEMTVAGE